MMFRLTLGLIAAMTGGSLIGNAIFFHPSLVEFPRRLVAALIGTLILATGTYLITGCRVFGSNTSSHMSLRAAVADGFTVFSLASLAFNAFTLILGKCDLDPTLDCLHMIPVMLMNAVWEALISTSGGSFLLTSGGIALFDGCIGGLIESLFFPLRRLAPPRSLWIVFLLVCFVAFEASVIRWMPFRC
jgi:hypothetical protein